MPSLSRSQSGLMPESSWRRAIDRLGPYSILLVERLFEMVKPKLLMFDWFAKAWTRFVVLRRRVVRWFASWTTTSEPKPD
jgi:hypothetical protein